MSTRISSTSASSKSPASKAVSQQKTPGRSGTLPRVAFLPSKNAAPTAQEKTGTAKPSTALSTSNSDLLRKIKSSVAEKKQAPNAGAPSAAAAQIREHEDEQRGPEYTRDHEDDIFDVYDSNSPQMNRFMSPPRASALSPPRVQREIGQQPLLSPRGSPMSEHTHVASLLSDIANQDVEVNIFVRSAADARSSAVAPNGLLASPRGRTSDDTRAQRSLQTSANSTVIKRIGNVVDVLRSHDKSLATHDHRINTLEVRHDQWYQSLKRCQNEMTVLKKKELDDIDALTTSIESTRGECSHNNTSTKLLLQKLQQQAEQISTEIQAIKSSNSSKFKHVEQSTEQKISSLQATLHRIQQEHDQELKKIASAKETTSAQLELKLRHQMDRQIGTAVQQAVTQAKKEMQAALRSTRIERKTDRMQHGAGDMTTRSRSSQEVLSTEDHVNVAVETEHTATSPDTDDVPDGDLRQVVMGLDQTVKLKLREFDYKQNLLIESNEYTLKDFDRKMTELEKNAEDIAAVVNTHLAAYSQNVAHLRSEFETLINTKTNGDFTRIKDEIANLAETVAMMGDAFQQLQAQVPSAPQQEPTERLSLLEERIAKLSETIPQSYVSQDLLEQSLEQIRQDVLIQAREFICDTLRDASNAQFDEGTEPLLLELAEQLQDKCMREFNRTKEYFISEVKFLEEQCASELSALKQSAVLGPMQQLQQQQQQLVQETREAIVEDVQKLLRKHGMDVQQLREQLAEEARKQIMELKAKHDEEVTSLREQIASVKAAFEQKSNDDLRTLQEELAEFKQNRESQLQEQIQELRKQLQIATSSPPTSIEERESVDQIAHELGDSQQATALASGTAEEVIVLNTVEPVAREIDDSFDHPEDDDISDAGDADVSANDLNITSDSIQQGGTASSASRNRKKKNRSKGKQKGKR